MSDDWKPGDLALCLRSSRGEAGSLSTLTAGGIYTVSNVSRIKIWDGVEGIVLSFEEGVVGRHGFFRIDAQEFRKIRPHTPDAEDEETIRLLNGVPEPTQ